MALLAAFFLLPAALQAAAPAAAAPKAKPDVTNWFAGPLKLHLDAFDMDGRGLERFPFDAYNSGKTHQFWTRIGHQFTEGGRGANHLDAGLRLAGRLGASGTYSKFRAGAFNSYRAPDWLALRGTADLSSRTDRTWEYGFGFATLQGVETLFGASVELRHERRLAKPYTLHARYAPTLMANGRVFHEGGLGLGVNWKRLGADAGYRVLLNGLRNSYGPELALRLWL
jgi:hypothetical protein